MDIASVHELSALLVEPSATQAKIIGQQLLRQGIGHVEVANSGAQALKLLHERAPTLVISALYLPDMSGADLLYAIRNDVEYSATPFILISSETRREALEPVRQAGVASLLPKPFTEAQLATALRATLDLLGRDTRLTRADIDLETLRVLLVDDSKLARKHIRQVLEGMGLEHFFEAENGLEAMQILEANMVDFVVTDYNMPQMDGHALIEYIRKKSWQRSVPVLMVTSEANDERLAGVQELGVVGVCDKPFEPATVRQLLAGLLAERA